MSENLFRFKKFNVEHNLCAQKVGTDGVLIGAWTTVPDRAKNILDIGTGSGLIALMLAQRSVAAIDAIDIDESAFNQAKINFNNSIWNDRIKPYCVSLQKFYTDKKYDLIISNPPFFERSMKPNDLSRINARHNSSLNLNDLVCFSENFINREGRLSVIIPLNQKNILSELLIKNNFFPTRITYVKGNSNAKIKRMMVESIYKPEEVKDVFENEIVIEDSRNVFTEDYKTLTKDFYLKF
jgi:tRNA1Val (adenine37-N6)-methyltransferase